MAENTIHILLIEDNRGDARLIREHLSEGEINPFTLAVESTLKSGLESLMTEPCDILLLDLSLPDSFGLNTIQTIRSAVPNVPIVVLTGLDDKTLGIQAMQLGAQDYLVKDDTDSKLLARTIRYAIERHNYERALRQSQEEYRSLIEDVFNNSTIGILILDRDFKIVWLNDAIIIFYGFPREELLGTDKRLLIDNKLKCIFEDPDGFAESLLSEYRNHIFDKRLECHILPAPTRRERWLEHWSQPIRSGMYAGGRIEHHPDITLRKAIEASEREKAKQLATAEERQRLARELHDSVTQTLFSSTVMSESALRQWEVNPNKVHGLLRQLHQLTNSALSEMRLLLLELRPASLEQQNLTALIQQLANSFQTRTGVRIIADLDEIVNTPADVKMALYRTLQEALNNAAKHAEAKEIRLALKDDARRIQLTISDDGKGFDAKEIKPSSLGVGIMQERAETIGADFGLVSSPGNGTAIHVVWQKPD